MCVACNPGLVSFLEMVVSRRKVLGGAVLSTAPLWMPKARAQGPRADVLFRNGTVITMDPSRPRAQALAVSGGKIMAVGSEDDLEGLRSPQTRIVDLSGGTLLPGLIDPHMHSVFVQGVVRRLEPGPHRLSASSLSEFRQPGRVELHAGAAYRRYSGCP